MRKAISLVALVITIVVLIILTGTVILTMGVQDNVVNKAQKAKDNNNLTTAQDKLLIELSSLKVQSSEENEKVIEYITEDSVKEKLQQKNITYIVEENIAKFVVDGYGFLVDENGNIVGTYDTNEEVSLRLPKEYQEVEYIESMTKAYINTKEIGNQNTAVEIKFSAKSMANDIASIFGAGQSYTNRTLELYPWDGKMQINRNSSYVFAIKALGDYVQYLYKADPENPRNISITNLETPSQTYTGNIASTNAYTTPREITLFSINRPSICYGQNVRIYYCKIYQQNELAKDFVPCYRKDDGAIGMYDLVTNEFYNKLGPDNFEKGQNVYIYK